MECVQRSADINPNLSPLMFYSDEEIDEVENDTIVEDTSSSEDNTITNVVKSRDELLVSKIRLVMTGVPPPPSFTIPRLDTADILRLWKDNQHLISDIVQNSNIEEKESVAISIEEAKNSSWPQVLQNETFDVHYNKSKASEDLEWLCSKYIERYVGNETSSWVNSLYIRSPTRTASAKKRARYRGWGHSPGRRLSHLARRRRAFTSANLQSVVANNGGLHRDKKMILVEIKKSSHLQKIKSKNSSSKKQHTVPTIKSNFNVSNNPKRALFQSPDDKPLKSVKPVSLVVKQSPNQLRIQRSKRVLWPSDEKSVHLSGKKKEFNINGKRGRTSLTPSPHKKCNRNLFSDVSSSRHKGNLQLVKQNSLLSNPHQKKLLWAISQALRDEGIRMNHQIFQSCLSVLNGPCLALWIWKTSKDTPRGSTSENMLAMVKQFAINSIIEQVQTNSSPSNLMSLRLGLMKKVETIKLKDSKIVHLNSEKTPNSVIESSEIKTDKENVSSTDNLVPESFHVVYKKSPLKDNNVKSDTPAKITLSEDCNDRSNFKTKLLLNNSDETISIKCDKSLFLGFDVDNKEVKNILKTQNILNLNTEETNTDMFTDMLSWNADPISRLQIQAPDFKRSVLVISANSTNLTNFNLTTDNSNVLFEDTNHTFTENADEENSTIEYEICDDETQTSSIYSYDLNNFTEESMTSFEFSNVHNVPSTIVCSVEET